MKVLIVGSGGREHAIAPLETLGTFPLPEAQMDRFLMKLSMEALSPAESSRKRKCPRIRHDTCSWYCSFHVQRHGCFQTAGQQPVRYGTEGCEILQNQERAQGISIYGKEKDLFHDLLHSAACRSGQHDFHASDKGKRTELRP